MTSRIRLVRVLLIGVCLQALTGYMSGPTLAAAPSQALSIQAGLARVWFLRQFEPGESLATPIISANGVPVGESLPGTVFLRDFTPGTYTFTVPSYGVDFGQAATVQLAAGTQTYLEVQSLRSWAGAGGDSFQRDTLYVRAILPYWAEKYFPTLRYLGQGGSIGVSRIGAVRSLPQGDAHRRERRNGQAIEAFEPVPIKGRRDGGSLTVRAD
jgi:hypothetical protein